jgi:hypothetical protein
MTKFNISLFLSILFIIPCFHGYTQEIETNHPEIIKPGKRNKAPSDAIILFDKGSLENFEYITEGNQISPLDGTAPQWKVKGRKFTIVPGTPNIQTKDHFGDCQLHIEWKTPRKDVKRGKTGQESGNSGIYLMGKYEVQILNSYKNSTTPTTQAGAIYNQYPPMVNASQKAGKWQTYDVIFKAPRYDADGKEMKPGYFTILHNGVLIQNHVVIKGPSHAGNEKTNINSKELPLMLQNHQNEVSFRNIWIRKL